MRHEPGRQRKGRSSKRSVISMSVWTNRASSSRRKTKAIAESEKQAKTYRSQVERNEKELKKVHAALETLQEYRTKHSRRRPCSRPISAPLNGALRGSGLLKENTQRPWKSFPGGRKKNPPLPSAAGKEADHEKARLEFEKEQTDLKILADEVTVLLGGRDIGQWRTDVDTFKERERLLVQTGETVARMDRIAAALDGLKTNREQLNVRHTQHPGRDQIVQRSKRPSWKKRLLPWKRRSRFSAASAISKKKGSVLRTASPARSAERPSILMRRGICRS